MVYEVLYIVNAWMEWSDNDSLRAIFAVEETSLSPV